MRHFDYTLTYSKGCKCILDGVVYVFDPDTKQSQFSTGILPTTGNGWRIDHNNKTEKAIRADELRSQQTLGLTYQRQEQQYSDLIDFRFGHGSHYGDQD